MKFLIKILKKVILPRIIPSLIYAIIGVAIISKYPFKGRPPLSEEEIPSTFLLYFIGFIIILIVKDIFNDEL